jgi:hypothetical protein
MYLMNSDVDVEGEKEEDLDVGGEALDPCLGQGRGRRESLLTAIIIILVMGMGMVTGTLRYNNKGNGKCRETENDACLNPRWIIIVIMAIPILLLLPTLIRIPTPILIQTPVLAMVLVHQVGHSHTCDNAHCR